MNRGKDGINTCGTSLKIRFQRNVVDLAVGVVIGAAFGKIVSSLVKDIITPLLGMV